MVIIADDENIRISKLDVGGTTWPNSYLVRCLQTGESALIDISGKTETIIDQTKNETLKYILMTHNHNDYVPALAKLKSAMKISVYGQAEDFDKYLIPLDMELKDGDMITFGKLKVKAIYTPGHTKGSCCFLVEKYLFSGDTLLPGGPGYTASPADFERIMRSLTERIFVLPDDTMVCPGHGIPTVMGKEKNEFAVFSTRPHSTGLCGDVLWLSS